MNVSDLITAAALTPAARPPIIPRRVTFDKVMKRSLVQKTGKDDWRTAVRNDQSAAV
jgi:hypothetical protein